MSLTKGDYHRFLLNLKQEIVSARQKAYQTINRQLVELYWTIGKKIFKKIEISKWGESVVEALSKDLQRTFPDMRGFSSQNIWRMKQFYETYRDNKKLSTVLRELPWSHNILILSHTKTIEEKEFYLKTCINEKWSFRELQRQIESSLYERYMLSKKTNKLIPHGKEKNVLAHFKDEYVFDILGLKDDFREKDLRRAIVANLKGFFLEFGRYFTLAGEEYRVNVGGEDYYVDLLFFHRVLKCLVAVDLKIGKFKPEYAGKMQFYLSALDEKEKLNNENPSVGLILCKSKNDEAVRIMLSNLASPMKIAACKTKLIDQKLLKARLHSLPGPEDIKEDWI
jgi:predicted nuclease of restriction endonuclease-like (RecB) superfamily